MIKVYKFTKDFETEARTLSPDDIGTRNGWTLTGVIHEDYYEWVNKFEAWHPVLGFVFGDFEDTVHAYSEDAYQDFTKNFDYYEWDYYDI